MRKGFFAYSQNQKHAERCIEKALQNKRISNNPTVKINTIKNIKKNNQLSLDDVTTAINNSDYICIDLTGMEDDILFVLGYSIGRKKDLFLLLDTASKSDRLLYRELPCLKSVHFDEYNDAGDIIEKLTCFEPWIERAGRINRKIHVKQPSSKNKKSLLYLKNHINTEFSRKSQEIINKIKFSHTIDDPSESSIPNIDWYVDRITEVPGVFIELSSEEREGAKLHNAKCSFVGGIALGLDRKLLLVAEAPYSYTINYQGKLFVLKVAEHITSHVKPYIDLIKEELPYFLIGEQTPTLDINQENSNHNEVQTQFEENELEDLTFGSFSAENEGSYLNLKGSYFDNWNIEELISTSSNLLVGRKGVGKTATLKVLANTLVKKEQTHVCVIEPLNEEMQDLDDLLKSLLRYQKTHLIQSIWKSLIYTQLVISLNSLLQQKDIAAYSDSEEILSNFIEENKEIFNESLSTRLANIIKKLGISLARNSIITEDSVNETEFKHSISESLHIGVIQKVNLQLVNYLHNQKITKIVVLIDNLDKAWERGSSSYEIQSLWINELINTSSSIIRDLSRANLKIRHEIQFNLLIFLRSDIFYYAKKYNPEPDKINYVKLTWKSQDSLYKAIDRRISFLNDQINIRSIDFWDNYIVDLVNEIPTKDYIYEKILPRPRDLIYFLTAAKSIATGDRNNKISEEHILKAYEEYSAWVFGFMKAESIALLGSKTDLLINFLFFIGRTNIVTKETIVEGAKEVFNLFDTSAIDQLIDHLISISILGLETSYKHFEYVYDFEDKQRMQLLSKRIGSQRYKIHNALIPFLKPEIRNLNSIESFDDIPVINSESNIEKHQNNDIEINSEKATTKFTIFSQLKNLFISNLNSSKIISFILIFLFSSILIGMDMYFKKDLIIDTFKKFNQKSPNNNLPKP